MPFIGQQPITGAYSKLDSITTSATATYNLQLNGGAYYPQSANHLLVSLNGVMQAPQDSFTVSGSQITFASALTSSDSIDFIMALGDVLDIGTPSDGSVNTSQLANSAVTDAKIASGITASKLTGALPAVSGASLTSLPTGNLIQVATLTKTASDHPAGAPYRWMDVSNCFTSTYNDYVIDYKIQSTDASVNTLNFALETSGASLDSNDQFSSPTFASTTFEAEIEYWALGTGTTGSVRAAASTYCFLGANTNIADASTYFEGRLWMKNVYSGTGFIYWAEHYMHNPVEYWAMPKGVATNAAAVNARGFRFFNESDASNYGESGNTRNVIGELTIFGVVGS
mgnify:CR=1 FL=1|tara:strand:- start:385 stop:1407 length:1023 start_codon:yes stop_codon:yes gene_type:complete